jgi:hypothetical protein
MGIKRYFANADNTITNAYEENLETRGTGSNMGASDILEVFSIYGQEASGSTELSRVIIQFPTTGISSDRSAGVIPASGSVNFFLKMYNAKHSRTLPRDYELLVSAVSASWQEGEGLDMENYQDLTNGNIGSNWVSASNSAAWGKVGGDYHTAPPPVSQSFDVGTENLEIDVTDIVEGWLGSTVHHHNLVNYGFGIRLTDSYEAYFSSSSGANSGAVIHNTSGATKSYYTKRFFGRNTEFHFKKPVIEARWESVTRDDRGTFYFSSSLAPAADNLNTIYLYNYVRGRLTNIPSIGEDTIRVSIFSGSADDKTPSGSAQILSVDGTHVISASPLVVTGAHVSTGIYSASFAFTGSDSLSTIYDVWFSGSALVSNAAASSNQFYTGSISTNKLYGFGYNNYRNYVLSMPNLQKEYYKDQTARLRLFVREKNWCPTVYSKATSTIYSTIIPSASFRAFRVIDNLDVISYGTGSYDNTGLSYDVSGSYFDLDMSMLEPGYQYGIKYSFKDLNTDTYYEQPYVFKFRVVE